MALPIFLVFPVLWALGAWMLWWLVGRATRDLPASEAAWDRHFLRRVLAWSYSLRVVLAVALYLISYWHWPILTSLQFRAEPGFWFFGLDSHLYHSYGHLIAQAWKHGTELPVLELGPEYFMVVAAIYRLLGAHPLYPILLNCWLAVVTGLLAFRIGRRLFGARAARLGALLVSCWPSSLLWSAQLLKDSLSWFLVFSTVALMLRLAFEERPSHPRGWRAPLLWIGLIVTVVLVTRLRFYLGSALSLAAVLILAPRGCALLMRRSYRLATPPPATQRKALRLARGEAAFGGVTGGGAIAAFGVALIVVVSTMVARTLDPLAWASPRHPEIGHRRLASAYWQHGDFEEADREFHRAIELNKADKPSYLGLASLHVQQARLDEALRVYARYLEVAEPNEQSLIRRTIAGLYVELADEALEHGRAAEAVASYERALAFDSSALPPFTYLGLMLIERGELELAAEFLQKTPPVTLSVADQRRLSLVRGHLAAKQSLLAEMARLKELQARFREEETRLVEAQKTLYVGQPDAGQQPDAVAAQRDRDAAETQLRAEAARLAQMLLTLRGTIQESDGRLKELLAAARAPEERKLPSDWQQWEGAVGLAVSALPLELGGEPETAVGGAPLETLMKGLSDVTTIARNTVSEVRPQELAGRRQGFVEQRGQHALVDIQAEISTPRGLLSYLPRALLIGVFAPFPWQWFYMQGSTGVMRVLSGVEMLFWYCLVPAFLIGTGRVIRSRRGDQLFLLVFGVLVLLPIALVIPNLGTLYRLRLSALLPLLIMVAAGEPRRLYEGLAQRLTMRRRRTVHGVAEPAAVPQPVGVAAAVLRKGTGV